MALRLQAGTDELLQQNGVDVVLLQDESAGVSGAIASTLAGVDSALSGTHVEPPSRSGSIAATLEVVSPNLQGTFAPLVVSPPNTWKYFGASYWARGYWGADYWSTTSQVVEERVGVGRKRIYRGDQDEVESIVMAFLENVA